MGASKRARKIRAAGEFDPTRLGAAIRAPKSGVSLTSSWSLADIFAARDAQMIGRFTTAARLAESMRTDDALAVAYETRLAPQRCIPVDLCPASGARGGAIAAEAQALFGQCGVGISADTRADIHGCLVNHGVAFGYNIATPRDDGSRIDLEHHYWPIEYVRWDASNRVFMARIDPGSEGPGEFDPEVTTVRAGYEVPIVHGDGRWVIYRKHEHEPWKQEAAIVPAALVWARHAFAIRDWVKGSAAHGNAKIVGKLAEGVALQDSESGDLTPEAAAFLDLLQAMGNSDVPVGIAPAGSTVDFITNNSSAWQVWNELVQNAEKAAARIYLGTDGTLGSQGGAPGVDIQSLFGVASTRVEGDLKAIERAVKTGIIDVWCALNFGDSALAPEYRYLIPDGDEASRQKSYAERNGQFLEALKSARDAGVPLVPEYVRELAAEYGVRAPLFPAPAAAPAPAPTPEGP